MWKQGLTFPHLHIRSRGRGCAIISMLLPHLVCSKSRQILNVQACRYTPPDLNWCQTFIRVVSSLEKSFSIYCNSMNETQSVVITASKKKKKIKIQRRVLFLSSDVFNLELWHLDCDVVCWHNQGSQSNIAFIESHLSAPSCITACDRMHWIKTECGAERERRRGCVCSPSLTAGHFQQQHFITWRVCPSLGQRGTPCKCWMWNYNPIVNLRRKHFIPSTSSPPPCTDLMYAALPAGLAVWS